MSEPLNEEPNLPDLAQEPRSVRDWASAVRRMSLNMDRLQRFFTLISKYSPRSEPELTEYTAFVLTEVWRTSVVFMHAIFEDFLRTLGSSKFPDVSVDLLERISLRSKLRDKELAKFTFADLSTYRGEAVDDVLRSSFDRYLETKSFSRWEHVIEWTKWLALPVDKCEEFRVPIEALMKRRHRIAHAADFEGQDARLPTMLEMDDFKRLLNWYAAILGLAGELSVASAPQKLTIERKGEMLKAWRAPWDEREQRWEEMKKP